MSVNRSYPLVSVIIPTHNAGSRFSRMLEAIRAQQVHGSFEIVVVDSGSTDGTLEVCRQYSARVVQIDPQTFNHGDTRNLGIKHCQGQYVLLTVQDAAPASEYWMQTLIDAMEIAPQVAGAYSRQLPHPEDDYLVKFLTNYWFHCQGERRVIQRIGSVEEFEQMPFGQRRLTCGFDDVSSMIRRSVWQRFPFKAVRFAEDVEWAHRVLRNGYHLVYEPASMVIHSHDRTFAYNVRRIYVDSRTLMQILGTDPVSLRSWTHPFAALDLMRMILRDAAAHQSLDARLYWKVFKYALAVMLATGLRRLLYPRIDEPQAPAGMRGLDAWLSSGI